MRVNLSHVVQIGMTTVWCLRNYDLNPDPTLPERITDENFYLLSFFVIIVYIKFCT